MRDIGLRKRQHLQEEKVKFGEGATRSKMVERYDLIPPIAHYAEALRYGIGVQKHGEGNWKHGDKQFVKQFFNHIQNHINDILVPKIDRRESTLDNVGAIKWAASGILWYAVYNEAVFVEAIDELHAGLVTKGK